MVTEPMFRDDLLSALALGAWCNASVCLAA
jgi:hypothetical protein